MCKEAPGAGKRRVRGFRGHLNRNINKNIVEGRTSASWDQTCCFTDVLWTAQSSWSWVKHCVLFLLSNQKMETQMAENTDKTELAAWSWTSAPRGILNARRFCNLQTQTLGSGFYSLNLSWTSWWTSSIPYQRPLLLLLFLSLSSSLFSLSSGSVCSLTLLPALLITSLSLSLSLVWSYPGVAMCVWWITLLNTAGPSTHTHTHSRKAFVRMVMDHKGQQGDHHSQVLYKMFCFCFRLRHNHRGLHSCDRVVNFTPPSPWVSLSIITCCPGESSHQVLLSSTLVHHLPLCIKMADARAPPAIHQPP